MGKKKVNNVRQGHTSDILRRILCGVLCLVMLGTNATSALALGTESAQEIAVVQEVDTDETILPTESGETKTTVTEETDSLTEEETKQTTEASEETTEASQETTEASQETTEASEETTEAPEETTEASEETTEATEETTEATEETTAPTENEDLESLIILAITHEFYQDGEEVAVTGSLEAVVKSDYPDGQVDLAPFAEKAEQIRVVEAAPAALENVEEIDGEYFLFGTIRYEILPGWEMVLREDAQGGSGDISTFDIFTGSGSFGDYDFVAKNVVELRLKFQYSKTGGLAGIDAAEPKTVQMLAEKDESSGNYILTYDSLPTVEGFRIVMNPAPLNIYLKNPPVDGMTTEQLEAALERGDFDVDIDNHTVYYWQQENLPADATEENPKYNNQYSNEYNEAWNSARIMEDTSNTGYTAKAICGKDHGVQEHGHGASALVNPKLTVTLTEAQLRNAVLNGLDITVNYRRNATWYYVNHWVAKALSGLVDFDGRVIKTVEDVEYVRLDRDTIQGRVGAMTRAQRKTGGVYDELACKTFYQALIQNQSESRATEVDLYYTAASSYDIIFNTNYAFIPRQTIGNDEAVDFSKAQPPERQGYTFAGWRYLKKDATPDDNGEYSDTDYIDVGHAGDSYTLTVNEELVGKAKVVESGEALAIHLYAKWVPNQTSVRVIFWTEDLNGQDVQATAQGGNPSYYNGIYQSYQDPVVSAKPNLGQKDTQYSNAGSFVLKNLETNMVLGTPGDNGGVSLDGEIKTRIDAAFANQMGANADFYTPVAAEIVQGGTAPDNENAAAADGLTSIYVYFNRNIYTLKFHYYGTATARETLTNYAVCDNTTGYTYAGDEGIIDSATNDLNFAHEGGGNRWFQADVSRHEEMPVPQTITIRAKYGADLRNTWPVARSVEQVKLVQGGRTDIAKMISWATTDGSYRDNAVEKGTETTLMGAYASMSEEIIADPKDSSKVHHLVAYWFEGGISYYRLNHCYEVPDLDVSNATKLSIFNGDTENTRNFLYLVPVENPSLQKYGFTDLLRVNEQGEADEQGQFYAVRQSGNTYYAVARQVSSVSSNIISAQNPSNRLHLTRVNTVADHSEEYEDSDGGWNKTTCGTSDDPYDLYFYYTRDRYTITYMAPSTSAAGGEVTLGTVTLPYDAFVDQATYGFVPDYRDQNDAQENGQRKYLWNTDTAGSVPVCPDRSPAGTAQWKFRGWALGPSGMNMQWSNDAQEAEAGQADIDFYIGANLRVYAIWERPDYTVTFNFHGGTENGNTRLEVEVPANQSFNQTGVTIPRPLYAGHTFDGWFLAEVTEDGQWQYVEKTDADESAPLKEQYESFAFDAPITQDMKVMALWNPPTAWQYEATVYHLASELKNAEDAAPTVWVLDGAIVEEGAPGASEYYVLKKENQGHKSFVPNQTLNFTAGAQEGYVPQLANVSKILPESPGNGQQVYPFNVIFFYDPIIQPTHTVRFIRAGTEDTDTPTELCPKEIIADITVVTPSAAALEDLKARGYQPVNREDTGAYTKPGPTGTLNWMYKDDGAWVSKPSGETLSKDDIPKVITYLAEPIKYQISYEVDSLTGDAKTIAEELLKGLNNPEGYNVESETFSVNNPGTFYDGTNWYEFEHWTVGEKVTSEDGKTEFTALQVDKGSTGDLTFEAHWKETTAIASLSIEKKVTDGGDPTKEFPFRLTLTQDGTPYTGRLGDLTAGEDGTYSFSLSANGGAKTIQIPVGFGYTITETPGNDYESDKTGDTVTGTVAAAGNTEVFTNTRKTGSLTVTKTVTGNGGETNRDFNFTVSLEDADGQPVNGTFGGVSFVDGKAIFPLMHNGSKVISGIPTGTRYEVTETAVTGYTTTKTGDTGTIVKDTPATAAFTNTKNEYGDLTVKKTVTGNAGDKQKAFHFTVTLGDTSISGRFGDMTFANGVASFTLRDGESRTAANLLTGLTYTVKETEENEDGYATTKSGDTGIITKSGSTASFTNAKNEYGNLSVKKTVTGNGGETNRDFTFTVSLEDADGQPVSGIFGGVEFVNGEASFTLKHNGSKVISGIPTGTRYEVTETAVTGYASSAEGKEGTITKGTTATVVFTNARDTGTLTVTKTVTGNGGETNRDFTFTVSLEDADGQPVNGTFGGVEFVNGKASFTLQHNDSKVISGIPTGTKYVVTETAVTGYTSGAEHNEGTILKDQTAEAKFTNARDTGTLTVTKTVTGNGGETNRDFTFTVSLEDADGQPVSGIFGGVEFVNGEASFTLKHNGSKVISGIPTGTKYVVTEAAVTGYTSGAEHNEGTILKDQTAEAKFTNARDTGTLTVTKTVTGNGGETNRDFNFTVSLEDADDQPVSGIFGGVSFVDGKARFPLMHKGSKVISGIPTGTKYVVTETAVTGYTTTKTGDTGTIVKVAAATAAFTNTKNEYGDLTVEKTVTGNAGDKQKEFHFTVTLDDTSISGTFGEMTFANGVASFTLRDGESRTAANLLTGLTYTVKETEENEDGYATTKSGDTGTITKSGSTASFTNAKNEYGNLSVKKTVAGNAGETDKDFHFTVTLGDASVSGTFGDMVFTNGTATFTLKHGEIKTGTNLPANVTYTVTEAEAGQDGYDTTKTDAAGTIEKNQTAAVVFTNTKNAPQPKPNTNITISKTVMGNGGEKDREFHFTLTLDEPLINGTYGDLTFTDGVAEFTLKDGQSKTARQIPVDITYTVTEQEADQEGYVTEVQGETGTLEENKTAVASFINTRNQYGDLTVSKTVAGAGAETDREFTFTVKLSDETLSGAYGDMAFTQGEAVITLKHGKSKTASALPAGITYEVTEADTEGYTAASTGETGTIEKDKTVVAAFVNTREIVEPETGSLTVSNEVAGNAADTQKDFHFTVTLNGIARDTGITGTYGEMAFTDGKASFSLKHGESKTATDLPAGISYTVTESEADQDGYTTTKTGDTGTISKDRVAEAKFLNTKNAVPPEPETGSLTVSKRVTGLKGDKNREFTFVVTLDDTDIQGTYGDMDFQDGRAIFTLKHGESATAENLPAGISYKVREGNNEGYTVTKSGDTGVIEAGKTARARFINYKGVILDFQPRTGDNTGLELWLTLMGVSLLGALTTVVISRKRKHK